ncbi:unnamed protein product [Orchesella dallaii]|uniref:Neurogenic mastermind-like N-terminal domain-containing protein n=1 Tax=Orchesella dallaii TaxID=48710 RepID=A0ABP1PZC4_9HEXA
MPKGQDQGGVLDRLRRRFDKYRKHHEEVIPRFDNTTSSQNQQQKQETVLLRQRFIETNKAKKSAKKSDKKQHSDGGGSSIVSNHLTSKKGPSKSNKRQNEDDQGGAEGYEPPTKIGGAGRGSPLPSNSTNSSLYKQGFSQNGKRGGNKTKALDSQKAYQASSSSHPKNGIGRVPQPPPPIPQTASSFSQCPTTQSAPPVGKDSGIPTDFADLDECAAALEQDAVKNGAITGSFMGENSTDEIFNNDFLNELFSDLNPEDMSKFLLNDGPPPTADDLNDVTLHGNSASTNGACITNEPFHPVTPVTPTTSSPMRSSALSHGHHSSNKMEGSGVDGTSMGVHGMDRGLSHCAGPSPAPASTASPLASQLGSSTSHQPSPSQSYNNSHFVLDNGQTGSPLNTTGVVNTCNTGNAITKPSTRLPYSSPAGLTVDSPAAQTLKHMAEQHQHKAQLCMNSNTAANGGVNFKNQGSTGSPVGSPYGTIGNYNGSMPSEFSSTSNMNPGSNSQVKQDVCSPGNSQSGFSPSSMMVDMASGGKRAGQHNGSPSGQSTRMPNMSSAGGSPIMSPISKSFNHPSPLNTTNPQGPIPPQQTQQSQQQPPYMPMNRIPGPQQPYSNVNVAPRYPSNNNSQISVASPKSVGSSQVHISDRGSPATQIDAKSQLRVGAQNQQQPQPQQQFSQQQQFHYGGGQSNSMPMEMGFNPAAHPQNSQMQPQSQQQTGSGQTINFTQQHLRMGNQTAMPVSRMPMPSMNRMPGVPQRMPGGPMPDMQTQQQSQPRPLPDSNQHPQRIMRPPPQNQHQRHQMMPTHQQQMSMGGMPSQQPNMPQMSAGSGMGGQMMNRFSGMPGNPQMMAQQQQHQQTYGMVGNMPMNGPGNSNSGMMPMRRPYGPGPGFQGMNPRTPGDQMLSSGSQNMHNSMGNPGVPHGEWMGNMNSMPDSSCPPYSGPQRHSAPQQHMRPPISSQQFHSGIAPNQAAPGQGPPQMPNNFGQPHHEHMMSQQNANYNMGVAAQNHSQQQQLHHHHQQQQQSQQQQQLPPNYNQHASGPNAMKMGMPGHHHPQQQQQQPMYSNSSSGFGMKPPDNSMMCTPQNSMGHHQQQQQQSHPQHMYNMGNMSMNSGGSQMNNNMGMSDQDFDLNLLVDGMSRGGDNVDPSAFNNADDLLNILDAGFH